MHFVENLLKAKYQGGPTCVAEAGGHIHDESVGGGVVKLVPGEDVSDDDVASDPQRLLAFETYCCSCFFLWIVGTRRHNFA